MHRFNYTDQRRLRNALQKGDTAAVREIINSTGQPIHINEMMSSAVNEGNIQTTRILLHLGAEVNGCIPRLHISGVVTTEQPLMIAVRMRHIHMVTFLLSRGAFPNAQIQHCEPFDGHLKDIADISALHIAIRQKNVEIVRILLKHGASVGLKDRFGNNCFHLLACMCVMNVFYQSAVIAFGESTYEAYEDIFQILHMLCNHHSNNAGVTNGRDTLGQTPLHVTALNRNPAFALELIKNGALLDVVCHRGYTPLSLNICCGQDGFAANIILQGACMNGRDLASGGSLIALCIQRMRVDCELVCRLLVFTGCKFKERFQRPYDKQQDTKEKVCDWLGEVQYTPHKLNDLSRICIRTFLSRKVVHGRTIVPVIINLPIPKLLIDYLLLRDIAEIAI